MPKNILPHVDHDVLQNLHNRGNILVERKTENCHATAQGRYFKHYIQLSGTKWNACVPVALVFFFRVSLLSGTHV